MSTYPCYYSFAQVLDEMRPYHEEWGGMELIGTSAYGVRLYRNGSSLVM